MRSHFTNQTPATIATSIATTVKNRFITLPPVFSDHEARRSAPLRQLRFGELETKIDQPLLVPIHFAKIKAVSDLADLIPNPLGEHRGLRVVEHDALLP